LQTDQYRKEGKSRGKNTAEKVGGGAIIGGIIGAIAGGGKGAAIGSAAGAGVGGGAQAGEQEQANQVAVRTVLNFTLQAPLIVGQATRFECRATEAERLAVKPIFGSISVSEHANHFSGCMPFKNILWKSRCILKKS